MRLFNACLVLLSSLLLCLPVTNATAFWGNDYLVEINQQQYSEDDYRHWWAEWQDPGMAVHDSVDEFVDFMLLSQEAEDMQLHENPAYRKKVSVFLKVRALMQFKAEEVDAHKVIPPHEELWQAYLDEYTPLLDLRMIAVQDEEQASVMEQFMAQGIAFDQLAEAAGLEQIAEQLESTGLMRYTRIPEPLRDPVLPLKQGETVGPLQYGHSWYFIEVVERQDGSEEDFEGLKQNLIRASLKRQENQLTQQLLDRLREEYQVELDQPLIDSIGPEGPSEADAEKIAITIGELKIPANFLFDTIVKTQKTRGQAQRNAETFAGSKSRIVNDILTQTLTEKEALARHYEELPPLKYVYDFYTRYRLIKELEEAVIRPQVKVSDEDIQAYYQANLDSYSQVGLIEFAQVTTNEQELAVKISQQLKQGADFFAVMQPISPAGVQTDKKPLSQLKSNIQEAIKELASGQATIVADGENTHFIKVIRSAERKVMPLENIRDTIRKTLEQKHYAEIRTDMINRLRELSTIKINNGAWKSLHKQLLKEGA